MSQTLQTTQPDVADVVALARGNTVDSALRRAAARWGERTALLFQDRSWSFAHLDTAADRVAGFLADLGVTKGDRVGCYGRNSDAYLLAWLGCIRLGAIHTPLNYGLQPAELGYIIDQAAPTVLLHDVSLRSAVMAATADTMVCAPFVGDAGDDVLTAALYGRTCVDPSPIAAHDIAQIMYTSGTTSKPKGAMMSHEAIMCQYMSCIDALDFTESDRSLAALPLYHTAQMHAFLMPQLLTGIRNRLIPSPDPGETLRHIHEERITSFFAPPTVWVGLLRHPDFDARDLSSLTKLYYGASIMPEAVLREIGERLPHAGLYNVYGQTEIAPVASVLKPDEHRERPTSAGRPVLFVQTRIVDEAMADVAPGTVGEIVHRSPQLLSGYWQRPDATHEAFLGGWFHSGDLGYQDPDGYLYIADRIKDVINTGGVLVSSREIEEVLFAHPAVSEVAVVAMPDPKWVEAVSAIVVLRAGETVTQEMLVLHCREHLASFKVPKTVHFRADLPRNASGKILKRELRDELTGALGQSFGH